MKQLLAGTPTPWEKDAVAVMQKYIASGDAIMSVLMYWRKIRALEEALKDNFGACIDLITQTLIDEYINAPVNPFMQNYKFLMDVEMARCVRDWMRSVKYTDPEQELKELATTQAVKLLSNRTSYIMLADIALRYAGKDGDYFTMSKEMNDELLNIEVK